MAPEIGTELVNPKTGTRTVFTATAQSTGGAYVEVEATYPPHSDKPPLHLHPTQEERFTVLTGDVTVLRGGEEFVATTGTEFTVAPNTPHQMWNAGDVEAVLRWRTQPALRTGEMFCELWEAARDGDWTPDIGRLLEILGDHTAEFQLC